MKRLIAFDLDGTLAASKSPIEPSMATLLCRLLDKYDVAVTSGGKFEQFKKQVIDKLNASGQQLAHLHILPTNAASYWRYNGAPKTWERVFDHEIPAAERAKVIELIEQTAKTLGYWEAEHWGPVIEDRGSQITFSALGQDIVDELGEEGLKRKAAWDSDNSKKRRLRDALDPLLPNLRVAVGGITSVDIMQPNVNKASGLTKLADNLNIAKTDVVYIGDRLEPGGNDAVVAEAGFDTIPVKNLAETEAYINSLL